MHGDVPVPIGNRPLPVGEVQLDLHRGVGRGERRYQRGDVHPSEAERRHEAEPPGDRATPRLDLVGQGAQRRDD